MHLKLETMSRKSPEDEGRKSGLSNDRRLGGSISALFLVCRCDRLGKDVVLWGARCEGAISAVHLPIEWPAQSIDFDTD